MAAFEWTEENTAELVRLWDEGFSAGNIAKTMLLASRNAVIGKIHRLRNAGYPMQRQAQTREQIAINSRAAWVAKDTRRKRREAAGLTRKKGSSPETCAPFSKPAVVRAPPPPPVIIDATFAKPWLERKFGECAYPISGEGADTVSCCAKTAGKTYCPGHYKVMFRKPEETGKRFVNAVARLAA